MITYTPDFAAWSVVLKRPYPRVGWSPSAIARRHKQHREREERREMMRMLANCKQRYGVLQT
jgi:hypothetical protein